MTGNVWFTSDLHLFHAKVAELRGFASIEEHNQAIIAAWKSCVQATDQIWLLGDNQASNDDESLAVIAALPGTKHLVAGNHDPVHPMHRNSHRHQRRYLEVFESVQAFARRKIDGRDVLLSHFPYHADHTREVRYMQYRLIDEGLWLLHGHTHSSEIRTSDREIHVGVDAWNMTPVPIHAVVDLMNESPSGETVATPDSSSGAE